MTWPLYLCPILFAIVGYTKLNKIYRIFSGLIAGSLVGILATLFCYIPIVSVIIIGFCLFEFVQEKR